MKEFIKYLCKPLLRKYENVISEIEINRILLAQQQIKNIRELKDYPDKLSDIEFRVFSQWGEDGIIQFLISRVPIKDEIFVEFGVQDYSESNTRFLLVNNNWKGLVIDSSKSFIKKIRSSELYWRHELNAINAFITKDNINELIRSAGINGDIGLLSIDIDGNDYWVWKAITIISPRIVICEYNNLLGCEKPITIPYDEDFDRTQAHYSNLYFGASLKALYMLANEKGYVFVGSNKAGSNAFFVRKDVAYNLKAINCNEGYEKSKARESIDINGRLTYVSGDDRISLIKGLEVFDIEKKRTVKFNSENN